MNRYLLTPSLALALLLMSAACIGQSLQTSLQQGFRRFISDNQLQYAMVGFTVQDDKGNTIFAQQENVGLAPASCQKIVTAAAALEQLGVDYRFSTKVGYNGTISNGTLSGHLLVHGSGDPTMGTWRYPSQPDTSFFWQVYQSLRAKGINTITGDVVGSNNQYATQAIPGGWIYDDIGNYYGSGSWALNYHENQFDATFNAVGNVGDILPLQKTDPENIIPTFNSFIKLGPAGTGDNSIIYSAPYSSMAYATGTLGKTGKPFTISGSIPFGEAALLQALSDYLQSKGIAVKGAARPALYYTINKKPIPAIDGEFSTYHSVGLDSVVYWFMQKSINLYGEALLKSMAYSAGKTGDTETGADLIRDHWAARGIDKDALRVRDGSGLSPQNRVTTKSLVQVLQYSKKQSWFKTYYDALPLIHNIKMKSGTISGAKGYAGYVSDKNGKQYTFALLVNNYTGTANAVVQKMWQLLDVIVNNQQ